MHFTVKCSKNTAVLPVGVDILHNQCYVFADRVVNFRIFAEVSANGSDPGPCSALREDRRRTESPGEWSMALAGEGQRTAHKSGRAHLAAGVGVSRGAPEGAVGYSYKHSKLESGK